MQKERVLVKTLYNTIRVSIQWKIAFWTGLCLLGLSLIIILYAASSLHKTALEAAKGQAVAVAQENAVSINEEIEIALNTARTLGQVLMTVNDPENPIELSREQVVFILKKVLEQSPQLTGVFSIWEPDAFDPLDKQDFDNQEVDIAYMLSFEEQGYFAPSWSRNEQGKLSLATRVGFQQEDDPTNFYQCPRQTRLECVTEPYHYPVQGEDTLIMSLAVPIIVQGEFLGVAGVDIRLDYFQSLADGVNIYDNTGVLALITYRGMLVAVTGHPDLVGQSGEELHDDFASDREIIRQGKASVQFHENDDLEIFVPIHFWRTLTPWSVNVTIPDEKITEGANRLVLAMVGIGGGLMIIALALMGVIARQIARPIEKMTRAAKEVAGGDLDITVTTRSADEIGTLAGAFNQMIQNLRNMIEHQELAREQLEAQNAEQQRLLDLVAVLETPVIPLLDGLLLVPIVGSLDSKRAARLTDTLLQEVYARHASRVILDITGVNVVDSQVVQAIGQLTQALHLLGCSVTMTGVSAAVATTMTNLGITLKGVRSAHSLQTVLGERIGERTGERKRDQD
jgi:methyl-accepting chemotaxis protein